MTPLVHHFVTMAYNNAWANHRLLNACAQLDDEQFQAPRTSFFPSLAATLNHNLIVDWFYVAALERGLAGLSLDPDGRRYLEPEIPFAQPGPLAIAQRDVDRRLLALCSGLDDDELQRVIGVPWRQPGSETVTRVLAHLFQHQIHHRGQAHAMLAGTGVAPPQLDEFFCAGDAPLRAGDFAELGWTEAMIWEVSGLSELDTLDDAARCERFVREVVASGKVWGLYGETWARSPAAGEVEALPVWPRRSLAARCIAGRWDSFTPRAIELDAFIEQWLGGMVEDGIVAVVLPTPAHPGAIVAPDGLAQALVRARGV